MVAELRRLNTVRVPIGGLLLNPNDLMDVETRIRKLVLNSSSISDPRLSTEFVPALEIIDMIDLRTLSQGILRVHGTEWFLPFISDPDFAKEHYSGLSRTSQLIARGMNLAFDSKCLHLQAVPSVYGLQGADYGLVDKPEYGVSVSKLIRRAD